MSSATAIINLSRIEQNLQKIRQLAPNSQVLAVCKANGYGHGLVQVANSLQTANAFGVARIEEAYKLRSSGIVKPIVLLEGFFQSTDLPHLVASNIETVVHCIEQLEAIEQATLDNPIQVWLKIDTGMTRAGIAPEELSHYYTRLKASANVKTEIRLMSHFACADELDSPMNSTQLSNFNHCTQYYSAPRSLANSAASLLIPESHFEWIRPGIILYGVSPLESNTESTKKFSPAMTLKSCLIAVKKVKAGSHVGYGATWTTTADTYIGIVAIGYGDGYPRHAKNGTPVWINGRNVPLIGRVSMDMITVDLGNHLQDKNGDEVELWGDNLAIETVAAHATTIPYELMCGLTSRVKLSYLTPNINT
ncbi:alanine racemase [Algibacillus agarilyticus]|uniref:alanine racemase n=1 Tax=Algibacillus agarilyticus TaxID=2234133 RepID=UPI001E3107AD|nr:alanine racemase [Algibacillus agarilyticus]